MKRAILVLLLSLGLMGLLQGCAELFLAGGATAANVAHDRRTAGSFVDDEGIELKALKALHSDKEINDKTHISVTSFNQVVLMTGEAPTPELRDRAEALVKQIPRVRRVHDEVVIASPSALSSRTSDTWITAKVKTSLFGVKLPNFDPTRVKVVTENGTVFLMGLLRRSEADAVVNRVRQVGGVQRVVKVFEYID
ncbi:MAG: BON domain-containing protein [Gammaproteobacteria bacterium]